MTSTRPSDPGDVGGDMGGEALITVTFQEVDGTIIVTTTIDYGSNEARDAALSTGMTDGMEASYRYLDGLLRDGLLGGSG